MDLRLPWLCAQTGTSVYACLRSWHSCCWALQTRTVLCLPRLSALSHKDLSLLRYAKHVLASALRTTAAGLCKHTNILACLGWLHFLVAYTP
eukprot:328708-Pelagomonas_calceolata.AAC.1